MTFTNTIGVLHSTMRDDYYDCYFVPEGTTILPNFAAMTFDENVYPDPHTLKPVRWLTEDGKALMKLSSDETYPTFVFG
jgi:cytochrome P450